MGAGDRVRLSLCGGLGLSRGAGRIPGWGDLRNRGFEVRIGYGAPAFTPWLAALLLAPAFRRRGIGEGLGAGVEEMARDLRFPCIYAGTGLGSVTSS